MFDIKVKQDDVDATVDALKFLNWTILDVHKVPVIVEWKELGEDYMNIEYAVLDKMFIITMNRNNILNVSLPDDFNLDASMSRRKTPGLFQLLIVGIRNSLAMSL
jgi:hypothetical protein